MAGSGQAAAQDSERPADCDGRLQWIRERLDQHKHEMKIPADAEAKLQAAYEGCKEGDMEGFEDIEENARHEWVFGGDDAN